MNDHSNKELDSCVYARFLSELASEPHFYVTNRYVTNRNAGEYTHKCGVCGHDIRHPVHIA